MSDSAENFVNDKLRKQSFPSEILETQTFSGGGVRYFYHPKTCYPERAKGGAQRS
jgi:hypothetical protein